MIMEKNWLIRTKSNHILGPVSKEKVLELYQNGSIKPDDELCSGNGYWFFVREEDLIGRYLLGSKVQSFNPISEAKDVLTSHGSTELSIEEEDVTMVGGINTSLLKSEDKTPPPTVMSALMEKELRAQEQLKKQSAPSQQSAAAPKKKANTIKRGMGGAIAKPALKRQSYIQYLAILCFLMLFLLIYYRKTIIRSLFQGEVTLTSFIMSEALAQEEVPEKKKSSLNALSL